MSALCQCGFMPASRCPGAWEPGCNLGANAAHVRVHDTTPEEEAATRGKLGPAARDNWRWVPVEATLGMLAVGTTRLYEVSGHDLEASSGEMRHAYNAMLAAAPHPPIAQPDVLRAAAEKARAALSDLLLKRDPVVYSDALRALDEALAQASIAQPQAALTCRQLESLLSAHFGGHELSDDEADSARALARAVERAHGIGATGAQPQAAGWRPIETAPRDGKKLILFYLNRNNLPRTVMARWLTDEQAAETDADGVGLEGGWYECIDNWDDYTEVAIHEGEPTHWQPLPEPPKEGA